MNQTNFFVRTIVTAIAVLGAALGAKAAPYVVEDFENIPVGTKWTMWNGNGNTGTSTATVITDPTNAQNKVLHVKVDMWGTFPQFGIDQTYAGKKLTDRFSKLKFRFYRPATDNADNYKQMHVYYGSEQLFADNSYPEQGPLQQWQQREYGLRGVADESTATTLCCGIHHANSEYYIDDIQLVGGFDEYQVVENGIINICTKNSASSYATLTTPTFIPSDQTLSIYTSRYTDLYMPLAGSGTLNIYAGGERTWLGENKNKKYADWTTFNGSVNIYPYKEVDSSCGFYGLVFGTNGKTFSPDDTEGSIADGKACNAFANSKVTLRNGATLAFESGTRGAIVGELSTEAGSRIRGYYKSGDATSILVVGTLGTDASLNGQISSEGTARIGLTKMGHGTYRINGNTNNISGGLRILEGRVCVNNDAEEAQTKKTTGGVGNLATGTLVTVYEKGTLGGYGNIGGNVELYGSIKPGDTSTDILHIVNYASTVAPNLTLHPESRLRFELLDTDHHDELEIGGELKYSTTTQDFQTSDKKPVVKVTLDPDAQFSVGQEITLIKAASKGDFDFNIVLPSKLTWAVEERTDNGYSLVLKVTSLSNDPANAENDNLYVDNAGEGNGEPNPHHNTYGNDGDQNTLLSYASKCNINLGIAVPPSRIDLSNANDSKVKAIAEGFNLVVPENELKFDWIEPAQNQFNFQDADNLYHFASNHGMKMRGHTLAWHSQVASWVSSDGKKNDKNWTKDQLMAILKNHVEKTVEHFKGRLIEWDVVNECLDDDQSIVRSNPDGYKLREQSVWTKVCGEEFIDSAFVWAHRTDPDCQLYLNDYDNEFMGTAKAQAFYNLARRLKNSGIPIDGVGLQCHFDAGKMDSVALAQNIARYADLGLKCIITELDLGISSQSAENLQQQANDYHAIMNIAMASPNCPDVLIWGISDDMSWRQSNPLIYNYNMEAKPAYYAVRDAFRTQAGLIAQDIRLPETAENGASVVSRRFYTIAGTETTRPSGFAIVRETLSDGSVRSHKIFVR